MPPAPPRLFCFGLGYSAKRLAGLVRAEGGEVAGTAQSLAGPAGSPAGIALFPFTRGRPLDADGLAWLRTATHVLVSIPPDAEGDMVLALHADDLAQGAAPGWVGYLSTTGVYGDRDGAPTDETAPLRPTSERSRCRVEAEAAWLAWGERRRLAVQIFRLAGIYGPGRSVLDRLRAGLAGRIDKPGHLFSRIHVDDLARLLRRSMERPRAGAVWNVCDDVPASQADVIAEAARLLGRPAPPLVAFAEAAPAMTPMALSFWRDNRRVDNRRVKADLDYAFLYPDYRSGLRAILAAEKKEQP